MNANELQTETKRVNAMYAKRINEGRCYDCNGCKFTLQPWRGPVSGAVDVLPAPCKTCKARSNRNSAAARRVEAAERKILVAALGWAPEGTERYCATFGELLQTFREQ